MLPGRAAGEILGIEVVQTTYPGMPGFLFAYNLYVTFTDPGDGVVGVLGLPGDPLRFETNVVSGFHQEAHLDGPRDLSVDSEALSAWPSFAWDTYLDIGYKSGDYGPQDPYTTEVLGIDFAWNDGGSFLETDFVFGGGYIVFDQYNTTQHIAGPDLRVFIGQLVVVAGPTNDGGPPRISGHVPEIVWYRASIGGNQIAGVAFDFDSEGQSADPVTLYVSGDAPEGGDGRDWSTAFRFLKDALDAAFDPTYGLAEIRVAQGVYRPDRSEPAPDGSGDRGASFQLSGGVTLRGGYAGPGAPDPDARDVELYPTILSGDLNGDDQPGFVNTPDNSLHVVFVNGAGPPAVLDGVTVRGGNADGVVYLGNLGGGMFILGPSAIIVNCKFIENAAGFKGGAVFAAGEAVLVNCVFSRNTAEHGGGLATATAASIVNCTFTDNTGAALIHNDNSGFLEIPLVYNCIFWGNTPEQVGSFPDAPGISPVLNSCDIQGGWTGSGSANIDADPLFVEPDAGDLRLSAGSPCVDVGYNPGLPPDTLDLDGDGDTEEPIPVELSGNPRIVGGTVDQGAYEGEADLLPLMVEETDFDNGETIVLVPGGGPFNPFEGALVIATNVTGPDDATIRVTEWSSDNHPGASGYSELAVTLGLETSLDDGQYEARVFIPFDIEDLAGADPLDINLTYFDPSVGNWGLAVAGNTQDSPGSSGPIGDRIAVAGSGPDDWGLSTEIGDYGVFWNPTEQRGFAWANVDHSADFAIGAALCPADCRQTPDGVINVQDLIALLMVYGPSGGGGGGPCDLDQNGVVDVLDLVLVLGQFGAVCP